MVFWNVIKCPIPPDALPGVKPTIRSAIHRMGLHGSLRIYAYGDKSLLDHKDVFREAKISCCVEREQLPDADIEDVLKNGGIGDPSEIYLDVLMITEQACDPAIIMVVPKPDQDSELHRVLECLQSRDHDVLLVDPPVGDSGGQFLKSAESVLACTQCLDGEPTTRPDCVCTYSS
ncbi:unnamed protein product [Microthlaspi erraticum]|uniref:NYN domain-containing protein n=1 Tax=Microthlaspi erraticum TaxID=1685480 RepID=A0A6D2IDG2_9BRAS|nr:unnamed protein product [Microthlaspi erraticum]